MQDRGGEQLGIPERLEPRATRIGIVDVGSQLLKPIDRKIREIGADTIIYPSDVSAETLLENCDAYVVSGGGDSAYDESSPIQCDPKIFSKEFPLPGLFICLGHQLLNKARGGTVEKGVKGRYGQSVIDISEPDDPFFAGFGNKAKVLMNAGDCITVDNLAPGLKVLALSREGDHQTVAAYKDETGTKIGVQFHPEVDLTENGEELFKHFIRDTAGLELNYTSEAKHATVQNRIIRTVGKMPVVTLASGGVDSTVLAAALHEEVGSRQHLVHIDTGLMRKGESKLVLNALREQGLPNIHFIDATDDFRNATTLYNGKLTNTLECETDPEAKRHIIGDTFTRIIEATFKELGLDPESAYLGQGTLRPDIIESAGIGKSAKKIKTHHNDTPLMREWRKRGMLVEPLDELHKDEVRELGIELGLPPEVVWRQPFPGPGLAIRIICSYGGADFEGRRAVENSMHEFADSDTSVHLLPIRSVGVQGDDRTYKYVAAISTDGESNWEQNMELAAEIPRVINDISRVIFMFGERISQKRSLFDSLVATTITPSNVETLQEADDLVNDEIKNFGLLRLLSQEPIITTPLAIDHRYERLLVVRPFVTNDFMVGSAAVPGTNQLPLIALDAQRRAAISVRGIGRFGIDLTGKPPGTVEWE